MATQPRAYLLHGFLGVGKTTFAKQLEHERNAIRFTHDEWMSRLYGNDPPAALFQQRASRVFGLMEDVWTRCLALGSSVVLDFGLWSRAERERVRTLVSMNGGIAVLYRLSCADDVAWQRIERRNRDLQDSLYITPSTYESLKARFEPLGPDEAFVDVEGSESR
jgi:predicted kinase